MISCYCMFPLIGREGKLNIGVLDMSGFENFPRNGFEQLCINVANERLQHFFNEYIFSQEQREYEGDGIDWTNIKYENNQPLLDLFLQVLFMHI